MATYGQTVRRGLPRRPGGDPWPAAGEAPAGVAPAEAPAPVGVAARDAPVGVAAGDAAAPVGGQEATAPAPARSDVTVAAVTLPAEVPASVGGGRPDAAAMTLDAVRTGADGEPIAPAAASAVGGARTIRRGLPRVVGGEPWPPASAVAAPTASPAPAASPAPTASPAAAASVPAEAPESRPEMTRESRAAAPAPAAGRARPLRRGLPRTTGGDPWPSAGFAPVPATGAAAPDAEVAVGVVSEVATRHDATPSHPAPGAADVSVPLSFTRTVFPGVAARTRPVSRPEPVRVGPFTKLQWAGAVIVGGAGVLFAAGMAVVAVRFLLSLQTFQDFLTTYPGEYPLPEGAPVGFPAWLGWQHFFNVFLMVLIIRTGLQVRREKRPSVFWSPRGNARRKISLNLWFHQALDVLWVTNGVIFIVLLFTTGQWMRIVPTSWEVFPNAVSAALQYVSLDWPTENGWVNYNSLQQLAYFTTVFLAAPLAIATGVRMSGIWPKSATALNKAYPVEWARKIHFPVMLYFVAFIIVHVALVFATGALRNLNHMYAAQDTVNWVGFWIFVASMVVIAAGWIAARPLVLTPIARLFGTVGRG